MQKRHKNKLQYFNEQAQTTKKYVLPYIENFREITSDLKILEIGCGEGGNLKPFLDIGCNSTGVDLSSGKIENGKNYFSDHPNKNNLNLICQDIYKWEYSGKFDILILRDVIEHIPNQLKFMGVLKNFINENGIVFFGFPPWQNPFGGHQQMCKSKFLCKLPWFHLLPTFLYVLTLHIFKEPEEKIKGLVEVKETGISIERFEKILKQHNYIVNKKTLFFINPNYTIKFGLKTRKQNKLVAAIPWMRNFFSTAAYYLVSIKEV